MIQLSKNSDIFILCPANYISGGPELLHQLCDCLNQMGCNAYMSYTPSTDLVPLEYAKYNVKIKDVEDDARNVLIIPETFPAKILFYKKIRMAFWWLSVDNFLYSLSQLKIILDKKGGLLNNLKTKIGYNKFVLYRIKQKLFSNKIIHLVQSAYAEKYLQDKHVESYHLSDYLNEDYFSSSSDKPRQNFILFNPAKGYHEISKYFDEKIDGVWMPLTKMDRREIINLMDRSKLYIDFGNHPGKDRLPREAVNRGCIVITNRRGAANFFEDVKIPGKYKVSDTGNVAEVKNLINSVLLNYDNLLPDFDFYRKEINGEKQNFLSQVHKIFKPVG